MGERVKYLQLNVRASTDWQATGSGRAQTARKGNHMSVGYVMADQGGIRLCSMWTYLASFSGPFALLKHRVISALTPMVKPRRRTRESSICQTDIDLERWDGFGPREAAKAEATRLYSCILEEACHGGRVATAPRAYRAIPMSEMSNVEHSERQRDIFCRLVRERDI